MVLGWKSRYEDDAQKRAARVEERVELVRKHRQSQGHELSHWQVAMVSTFAAIDPKYDQVYAKEVSSIADAIAQTGVWRQQDEWRISTWFDSAIERKMLDGKEWYQVSVACDGQTLSCRCPTIEKAFAFLRLYQQLIVDQFYSVGPPWADNHVFGP